MSTKTDKVKQERGIKLIECIDDDKKDEAEALLKQGVDLGVVRSGDCPIHYAARKGNVEMLELLISFKDKPNRPNQNKNTPIHLATREGHIAAVQYLKAKNVNLNPKNEDGDTPLHAAVIMQSMDFIEKLVSLGMKVNETNKKGQTALHQAVLHSRQEAMEALLFKKANPSIKDKDGKAAADLAKTPLIETQLRTYAALKAAKDTGYITAQGTSVNPKKVMELKLDRVDVHVTSIETKELLPFQIYCRREKTENSGIQFQNEEAEEAISDIFQLRVTDCIEAVSLELSVPLYSQVKPREQVILKMVDKDTKEFDQLMTKDGRMYSQLKLDLRPNNDEVFVLFTKPKVEELVVSAEACVVQSKIEESFKLEVPENTFSNDTKLTLKVYENSSTSLPPRKKRKTEGNAETVQKGIRKLSIEKPAMETQPEVPKVPEQKNALLSNLYEINVEGNQPSKAVKVQCPANTNLTVVPESDVIIVTADENNLSDEKSLQVVESKPTLIDGKFVFNVSHFSTYVPVLRSVYEANPRDIYRQIINAKKRRQPAVFFVMVLEQVEGDYNNSIAVVEVIESRKADARMDFWQRKGYTRQLNGESDNILTEPNQEFTILISGNVIVDGAESKRKIAFMPRRASSQPFRLCLNDLEGELTGEIRLVPVTNIGNQEESILDMRPEEVSLTFSLPAPPKLLHVDVNVSATKFNPANTDLKGPIVNYLKTLFYKHPWIDQKHEAELNKKCDALLKGHGVLQPPPVMIKNTISFCKKTFDTWREQLFNTLVHNEYDVDTAGLSLVELSGYILADYVPPGKDPAYINFTTILRACAHRTDAFVRSTNGTKRKSDKSLPVTNSAFWKNYQTFLDVTDVHDLREMERMRAIETKNIARYQAELNGK